MNRCPTDTQLVAYHACELRDSDRHEIDTHLQLCEECARRDAALVFRHQSWVARLREAGPPQSTTRGLRGLDDKPATDAPAERETAKADSDSPSGFGVIAGYELERELARGGQGIVYQAVQRSTKRKVALKVLREGPFASLSARRRFEREIELVAGLRHPNIVQVYDSGVAADGRHYFAMDLVEGVRLDQYARERRLDVRGRLALFAIVCDAVNHAHQRGIIHRDLKPSNILVDAQGHPHILDFGLARQTAGEGEPGVTTTAMLAGTLAYLSPEQARGKTDELDIRSDVYSLGVVLYELLTGTHPYPVDGDMTTILNHILDTPPLRPDALRRSAPAQESAGVSPAAINGEVETIMFKTLAKERERRYQTAGELARDIRQYLAGEPIDAKRDSHWYLMKKALRRYRVAATAAALVFVVVLCSAVALGVMYRKQGILLDEVTRQQQIAVEAEALASERFEDVRTLARSFIFNLNPLISHLPGSTKAQEFIVQQGLTYLDRLAASGEMSPELKNDLAAAYFTIGDIQFDPDSDNLDDPAGALESYHKGLKLLYELSGPEPDNLTHLHVHWIVHMRMSKVYFAAGQREEGREYERRAIVLAERMYEMDPEDTRSRSNLSYTRGIQADRKRGMEQYEEALSLYEESYALVDAANEGALTASQRHGDAQKHCAVGQTLIPLGRLEDALVEYQGCLEGLAALVEDHPHNARFLSDLAICRERVGFLLHTLERVDEALEHLEAAIAISSSLLEVEPNNVPARSNLLSVQSRLGEIHLSRGDVDQAREYFDASAGHAKALFEKFPTNARSQREWAVVHYKESELHRHLAGKDDTPPEKRIEHLQRARAALKECLREFEDMRDRGVIWPTDAGVPDMLAEEIKQIDEEIKQIDEETARDN